MRNLVFCAMLLPLLLGACRDETEHLTGDGGGLVKTELSGYNDAGEPASSDTDISGLVGYHFENGILQHVYDSFRPVEGGYALQVNSRTGTLYIVAWSGEDLTYSPPSPGTAESDWLETTVSGTELFFTGSLSLSGVGTLPVTLRRGMARFELRTEVEGEVSVRSAVIRNAAQEGRLFPGEELPVVSDLSVSDVVLSPFAYVHEQVNSNLKVTVDAVVDGRDYTLEAALPERVVRNTRYTVTLRKDSQTQEVTLAVLPWKDGGTSEALPDRSEAITIDAANSDLPAGALLTDAGRTLVLPHSEAEFTLRMAGDEQLELVSADGYLLEVKPLPAGSVSDMNAFRIRKRLYAPGVEGREAVMQFRRKGLAHVYPDDRIVLRLLPNPTVVEGPMNFDTADYGYDFGRYVDNELGVFTLPEGSTISVEFAPDEDPWIRLDAAGDNRWRIVGGWRPNDPTANGRRQEAVIVVTDGTTREAYTVARRNYGLPVTWLQGIWWCKYNAMGRSDSFEDQILSSNDPAAAAGMSVYDYLASCSPEEYRRLWQWAYQGSSGQGMKVVEQDGRLVMDGFSMDVADHINRLPADALSPDGYELPSMDDFNRVFDATDHVWLMWNGTHTLKNPWNGHSLIKREQRRRNDVTVDGIAISDLISIAMGSPDYPDLEPVVWYGPGAQWNADGIQHAGHYNNMLFGVYSPAGEGWYMAGAMNAFYLHKNGAGNRDTRILRFRKSEVEYLY